MKSEKTETWILTAIFRKYDLAMSAADGYPRFVRQAKAVRTSLCETCSKQL